MRPLKPLTIVLPLGNVHPNWDSYEFLLDLSSLLFPWKHFCQDELFQVFGLARNISKEDISRSDDFSFVIEPVRKLQSLQATEHVPGEPLFLQIVHISFNIQRSFLFPFFLFFITYMRPL